MLHVMKQPEDRNQGKAPLFNISNRDCTVVFVTIARMFNAVRACSETTTCGNVGNSDMAGTADFELTACYNVLYATACWLAQLQFPHSAPTAPCYSWPSQRPLHQKQSGMIRKPLSWSIFCTKRGQREMEQGTSSRLHTMLLQTISHRF